MPDGAAIRATVDRYLQVVTGDADQRRERNGRGPRSTRPHVGLDAIKTFYAERPPVVSSSLAELRRTIRRRRSCTLWWGSRTPSC